MRKNKMHNSPPSPYHKGAAPLRTLIFVWNKKKKNNRAINIICGAPQLRAAAPIYTKNLRIKLYHFSVFSPPRFIVSDILSAPNNIKSVVSASFYRTNDTAAAVGPTLQFSHRLIGSGPLFIFIIIVVIGGPMR